MYVLDGSGTDTLQHKKIALGMQYMVLYGYFRISLWSHVVGIKDTWIFIISAWVYVRLCFGINEGKFNGGGVNI